MTGKTKVQLEGENIIMRNVIDRMKQERRDCSQCVYLKIAQENPAVGTEPDMDGKTKAELEVENKILREKLDKYANADLARRRAMRAELAEEPAYRKTGGHKTDSESEFKPTFFKVHERLEPMFQESFERMSADLPSWCNVSNPGDPKLGVLQNDPRAPGNPSLVDDTARKRAKWLHKHGVGGKHHEEWLDGFSDRCGVCGACPGKDVTDGEGLRLCNGPPFPKPPKRGTP